MGCLLELILEVFFEGMVELIGYCYIKLMQLIVPDKIISEKTKKTIKNVVTTFAVLLALALIIGVLFLIQDDPVIKNIGKYLTYIPLGIIALQVSVGILVMIIGRLKSNRLLYDDMSQHFSIDQMKQHILSVLPSNSLLIEFIYDKKHFGNMIVKIKQNGIIHTFTTDRGEIYYNNQMLCDSSYQYIEKQDTFNKLLQIIKNILDC